MLISIWSDLNMSWKMLHFARVILEKSPDSTREKVKIFAALAEVSMQRGSLSYLSYTCIYLVNSLDAYGLTFCLQKT
jgi:hypothetical protein